MAKKRKSRGRGKGSKGKAKLVQCDNCGAWVPRDKIVRVTRWVSPVDPQLEKELKAKGAIVQKVPVTKNYCISCAIHMGLRVVRSKKERKESYSRL